MQSTDNMSILEYAAYPDAFHRGSYWSAHVFIEFIKRVGEKR